MSKDRKSDLRPPPERSSSRAPPGKPPGSRRPAAIAAELGGDLDFEPDALLDSLFEEPAPVPPNSPSAHEARRPESDAPADDLSAHEFEELPASSGRLAPSYAQPTSEPPSSVEDADIDALLAETAEPGEAMVPDWENAPTGRLTPGPIVADALDDDFSERATPPDRDAPTRLARRRAEVIKSDVPPGVVDLSDDSYASIPDYDYSNRAVSMPDFGRADSFASIQDHELEIDELARRSQPSLESERDAEQHLLERDWRETWLDRAALLEREANAKTDPQARARALLVASELWAMAGDSKRAREAASTAAACVRGNPWVARQHRWIAAAERDFRAVLSALDAEAKTASTPEARAHANYLAAEVLRLPLADEKAFERKLEHARSSDPNDPRAYVTKLAVQLAKAPTPPRTRLPEGAVFASLNRATEEIIRLRGGPSGAELGDNPKVLFQAARRALALGDRSSAAQAVAALSNVPALERPASWLAAALSAPKAESRPRAIQLLTKLVNDAGDRSARRALGARALEQSNDEALRVALSGPDGGPENALAFSAVDRVALAVLSRASEGSPERPLMERLSPWLNELAEDEVLRPLASAAMLSATAPGEACPILPGTERTRSELALAYALLSRETDRARSLAPAVRAYADTHGADVLSRLLELELALAERDAARAARALHDWPTKPEEEAETTRDRHWASALLYELAGDRASAGHEFERALAADPSSEASVRARLDSLTAEQAAELFAGLAESCADNTQASLLFSEAALRVGADDERFAALIGRAAEAQPSLPFAHAHAEQMARRRADVEALLKCLRLRRDYSTDSAERALDLVREALLVADEDMQHAAAVLDEAAKSRPLDVGLHELYERLTTAQGSERGHWREHVAEHSEGLEKLRLLVEAALEYERAGDRESASRAATAAADNYESELARVIAERSASARQGAALLSERLFAQARAEQDPRAQRELYERLSALDGARGDSSSALLWHSAILERTPDHLPALRRLEHAYIGSGRDDALEPIAAALAPLLDANETNAHAFLAARLRLRAGSWNLAREMVEIATRLEPSPLWALRALAVYARAASEDSTAFEVNRALSTRAVHATDAATLALRAGEAAARLGKLVDADALLSRAAELVPRHLNAMLQRAEVLEARSNYTEAAHLFEQLAAMSSVPAQRRAALHHAGVLWIDKLADFERGRAALERATEYEPVPEDVFVRLQAVYVAQADRAKLASLLERRLRQTEDPEQRIVLEVTRGRALADVGDRDAAKRALSVALDANPDHPGALAAFADVCSAEGDFASAEQALIRLARHVQGSEQQAEIYRKLAGLYERDLKNPERAELAYKEVLKRRPDDLAAAERLVHVYGQLGQPARAVELQMELVERADSTEQKRDATIGLAVVYESILGDRRKAEGTLERARKTWSQDARVLRALAELHQRAGEQAALSVLLDRAAADARRALQTGRFDPAFFEMLGTVAELRGQPGSAAIAGATLAALNGQNGAVQAAGLRAADPGLDDLLAPELLSQALRALLWRTGEALDRAYPVDLRALRATPLSGDSRALESSIRRMASAFGLENCEVYVSPVVGRVCLPGTSKPASFIIGQALVESDDDAVRTFLILRTLKILQGRSGALARTAPIELWPVLSGFLGVFAPHWQPQGVDARRLADARQRLDAAVSRPIDPDLPTLALEVIGAIGNKASQLATNLHQWGNRAALLSTGDPACAFRAIAFAAGSNLTHSDDSTERLRWIVRNPEARDVAVFSVTEQYAEARRRLGL